MKENSLNIVRAWKDPIYRNSLSAEELAMLPVSPIGEPMSEMEASLINGGMVQDAEMISSSGWFCSISGECNGGRCCNPFGSYVV